VAPAPQEAHLHVVGPPQPVDAETVVSVLDSLLGVSAPITLWLLAREDCVEVGVNCESDKAAHVERAIRGATPHWELTRCPNPITPSAGFGLAATMSQATRPDWLPVRQIVTYKDIDPLASFLEAAQPMAAGDELLILLHIRPASQSRQHQALWDLTVPAPPATAVDLVASMLGKGPRMRRFEPQIQRLLEERLSEPGFEVQGLVMLSANEPSRLRERTRSLEAAYATRLDAGYGGIVLQSWDWRAAEPSGLRWHGSQPSLYLTSSELACFWHPPSSQVTVPGVVHVRRPAVSLSPTLTQPTGLSLGFHRQRGTDVYVHLPRADLEAGHLVAIGRTGVGKSTFQHHLLRQLIRSKDRPGVWVLDPHGDLCLDIALQSIPPEREADVLLLEPGVTEFPVALPFIPHLPGIHSKELKELAVQSTFSIFRLIFREHWSPTRMEDAVFAITATLCQLPGATLLDIPQLLADAVFRHKTLAQFEVDDPVVLQFWAEYDQLSRAAQRELARPILSRIRAFYRSSAVRNIVCQTRGIDPAELLPKRSVVLVSGSGPNIQADVDLILELIIARLHLATLARLTQPRDQRNPTYLAVDESQRFQGGCILP